MHCPTCQQPTEVLRTTAREGRTHRRRECAAGHRFSTAERVVSTLPQGGDRRSATFRARHAP